MSGEKLMNPVLPSSIIFLKRQLAQNERQDSRLEKILKTIFVVNLVASITFPLLAPYFSVAVQLAVRNAVMMNLIIVFPVVSILSLMWLGSVIKTDNIKLRLDIAYLQNIKDLLHIEEQIWNELNQPGSLLVQENRSVNMLQSRTDKILKMIRNALALTGDNNVSIEHVPFSPHAIPSISPEELLRGMEPLLNRIEELHYDDTFPLEKRLLRQMERLLIVEEYKLKYQRYCETEFITLQQLNQRLANAFQNASSRAKELDLSINHLIHPRIS